LDRRGHRAGVVAKVAIDLGYLVVFSFIAMTIATLLFRRRTGADGDVE